jgi:hypothetical protein
LVEGRPIKIRMMRGGADIVSPVDGDILDTP